MSKSACYVLFLLLSLANTSQSDLDLSQVNDWADDISTKILKKWEDISGYQHLLKAYKESLKKVTSIDKKRLLIDSAQKMEQYFRKKIDSLQRIKTGAEKAYAERHNVTVTAEEVKYVNVVDLNSSKIQVTLKLDKRFNQNITASHSGIQIPTNVYHEGLEVLKTINWTSRLDEVFIDNFINRDDTLKWQYFGSRDAVFRTYPAKRWTKPYYSARRRPWYTQGATSPKNMVIMIDSSGSMVGKTSIIGRLAVSNLIDTLTDNDFFNIIYFNTRIRSLSCNKTLVQATKQNREWFKSKLITTGYKDAAQWEPALREAFQMLEKAGGAKCQQLIMIFTDGTEEKCEDVFERYNKNKKIRVFTYHLGASHSTYSSDDLTWMACSNKGYHYKIPTVGAVRDLIEDYVSVLSRPMATTNESLNPVWTGVYRDASGLGMMVTVTLPVFHEQTFLGVCGTDLTISQLVNFVYQPYIGAGGYPFMIDNNGHTVTHPNLRAMYAYSKTLGSIDLTQAEFVPEEEMDSLLALRENMLSIEDGVIKEETFSAYSFTEYERYLRITPVERTYIFTKLKETPFSLGITSQKFGYKVVEWQPYIVGNNHSENGEFILLEDWEHCNSTNHSLKTAPEAYLRSVLQKEDCYDNTLLLDLNITQNIWPKNISGSNITAAFVKTNWGLLRVSQSDAGANIIEERMFQRINNLKKADSVVVSPPYNDGKSDRTSFQLLIYKGIQIDVSKMSITPAVSGFQINEEIFLKEHLMNLSSKDNYHVYLLDENAFIVSSSLNNSENSCGQFLGNLDWELMSELEKGNEPLYTRFTLRNEQGECLEYPSKSSSSSFNYPFYSTLSLSLTSWIKNVLACLLHFNIYNLLFVDAAEVVQSSSNRTCVTNITSYYGNVTRWKSFSGNVSCLNCGDPDEGRQFFVAPVRGTNLVLVVVEHLSEKAKFHYTKRKDNIPGEPREIEIQSAICHSYSELPRRRPERCVLSQSEEKQYSCGGASILKPTIISIILELLYHVVQLNS